MKRKMAWVLTAVLTSNLVSMPVMAQSTEREGNDASAQSVVSQGVDAAAVQTDTGKNEEQQADVETGSKEIESFTKFDKTGLTPFQILTVEKGTPLSELNLPQELQAVADGEEITVPVTWNCTDDSFGGNTYNPDIANDAAIFTFTAQPEEGYTAEHLPYIEVKFNTEVNKNAKDAELEEESLQSTESNSTLQYIVDGSNAFDIRGINSSGNVQTTYSNNGYEMYLCVGNKKYNDSKSVVLRKANGKVGTFEGIQYQPKVSFTEDGAFVKVTYLFHNLASTAQQINICGGADIKIGQDDRAPITRSNTGFTMVDSDKTNQFSFFGKSTYGVTPVDSYWFGEYSNRRSNYFKNTSLNQLTDTDSGMAFSWQDRTLQPGETKEFTVLFGVGEASNPPQLDVDNDISLGYDANKVDVTANVTEKSDRTYRLYYALDGGTRQILNIAGHGTDSIAGTGSEQALTGAIEAADWEENSVHTVEIWAQNDKNAMSEVKSVRIVKLTGGETGEVENRTVTFEKGGAAGTAPDAVQAEDLGTITLPSKDGMTWTNAELAGWTDGTSTYAPGTEYVVPYGSDVTLTAVWNLTYQTEYYLEDADAGEYTLQSSDSITATAKAGTSVTARAKTYEHYVQNKNADGAVSTMTLPANANETLGVLRVYYDREVQTVTFNANGGELADGSTVMTREVRYGTKLGALPELKERAGYSLFAWGPFAEGGGFTPPDENTIVEEDATYYAVWTANIIWLDSISNQQAEYGTPISEQQLTVRNGSGNYKFTSQNLPDGLVLSEDGKLSGTPLVVTNGDVTATIDVVDTVTLRTDSKHFKVQVSPRTLTVTGAARTSKVYNADNTMDVGNLSLENLIPGDTVAASATASFTDVNAGEQKTIQLNGIALNGKDAEKYTIGDSAEITGKILPRPIKVTAKTQTKKTGEENPAGVLEEAGIESALQGSDVLDMLGTPAFDFTAVKEKAGSYPIGLTMENVNANYTITCNDGSLIVTQTVPAEGTNYSVTGGLGNDGWYMTEAILKPAGAFDKIVVKEECLDQLSLKDKTQEITFYLKNTTTGEFSAEKTITLKSDTQAPVFGNVTVKEKNTGTLAEIGRTLTFGHFFKEAVTVSVPVTDSASGVKTVEYCLPGGEYKSAEVKDGTASFDIPLGTDGTIQVRATDHAGNQNTGSNLQKDNVDVWVVENTAPSISRFSTISTAVNGWYNEDVTLTADVTDTNSGLNTVSWSDGKKEQMLLENPTERTSDYHFEQTLTLNGTTTVTLHAEDNAKNTAEDVSTTVKIDKEVPQLGEVTGNPSAWQNKEAEITFTLKDELSGVDESSINVTKDGIPVEVSDKSEVWHFTTEGNGSYLVNAKDNAGNALETASITVTKIKTTKPAEPNMSDIDANIVNGNDPDDTTGLPATEDGWYTTDKVSINLTNPETTEGNAAQYYCYRIWEEGMKPEDSKTVVYDGTNPPQFDKDGVWNVEIWLEDEAGNKSESVNKTLKIDSFAPEILAEEDHFVTKNGVSQTAEVTLNDAMSGINQDNITVWYQGKAVPSESKIKDGKTICTFDVAKGGIYKITGIDEAGNKAEFEVTVTALQAKIQTGTGAWGTCDLDELLSAVDLSSYNNGETVTLSLSITPEETNKVDVKEQELFKDRIRSDGKLHYLNIALVKTVETMEGTSTSEELMQSNKNVTVTVQIPENLRGKYHYQILRMHDGVCEVLDSKISEDGTSMSFTTDKFSIYALSYTDTKEVPVAEDTTNKAETPDAVQKPAVKQGGAPSTSDHANPAVPGVMAAIAALAAAVLYRRKK